MSFNPTHPSPPKLCQAHDRLNLEVRSWDSVSNESTAWNFLIRRNHSGNNKYHKITQGETKVRFRGCVILHSGRLWQWEESSRDPVVLKAFAKLCKDRWRGNAPKGSRTILADKGTQKTHVVISGFKSHTKCSKNIRLGCVTCVGVPSCQLIIT